MRRYKLVSQLRLSRDDSVNLVVNVYFLQEVLTDVVKELMEVIVVVVNVACVRRMIAVLFKNCKCNTAVYAERVNWHKTFVARFLLNNRESSVLEVLRGNSHKV